MNNFETPIIRHLRWLANSKKNLLEFPREAQKIIGDELQIIQFGGMPKDSKPFKGLGAGIFEIAIKYNKEAYRTVLAVRLGKHVYVLHVFQKKSKKGIGTPQEDRNLIKKRLRDAKELEKNEK